MQYTVKPGDNLSMIGARFGVPYQSISGYSSGNPNLIRPGEILNVPNSSAPVSKPLPFTGPPVKNSVNYMAQSSGSYRPASANISNLSTNNPTRINVVSGTPGWLVPILKKVADKYGIPIDLFSALAKHESAGTFNPTLREYDPNGLGRGIFQIDLGQHQITEEQAFDPNFAADYAAKLLKDGYDKTGSWRDALRYYNGGPSYSSSRPGYQGKPVNELTNHYADVVTGLLKDSVPIENPDYKPEKNQIESINNPLPSPPAALAPKLPTPSYDTSNGSNASGDYQFAPASVRSMKVSPQFNSTSVRDDLGRIYDPGSPFADPSGNIDQTTQAGVAASRHISQNISPLKVNVPTPSFTRDLVLPNAPSDIFSI